MSSGKSYVLNLKRRPDRLERFQKFYVDLGPELALEVFEAIDGSNFKEYDRVPESIKVSISNNNDFNNKSSIRATAYSHMMIWLKIANGEEAYGMVYEDDCFFRTANNRLPEISKESLKTKWPKIIFDYSKELEKPKSILYFGVGDLLPIHTVPPSESILIAQEKNHVVKPFTSEYYAKPRMDSPYVFNWLGLGGYVLSKIGAKYLLKVANIYPMECAIDVWIKKLSEKSIIDIYFTIPLFGYFPNVLDSDTGR
jgi:GR25 family glycosyltransferase involved in LPS biosynthesis